jgi:phenylalanyl-tRNA synthetase alpha chain
MVGEVEEIVSKALEAISASPSLEALRAVKIAHLSDRSPIARANQGLAQLPADSRAALGKVIGTARAEINLRYVERERELEEKRDLDIIIKERVDVSLPVNRFNQGALHPLTILSHEISELFTSLGYSVQEGPELESSWLNFDALNMPENHPARSMQDTFFIEPISSGLVLRTHTSPVQIRTMLQNEPPLYVICPGRTYRADELDATHTPVFNQVEGLVIDREINMSHLKGTLDLFAAAMFGSDVTTRIRPSFFPFTEPSAEVDFFYNGRWVEWGGCGMVHPKVLQACGIDSQEFSGFAFGMGLERTLMVRHGIRDMHDIVEGDVRFSKQFGVGNL